MTETTATKQEALLAIIEELPEADATIVLDTLTRLTNCFLSEYRRRVQK